MATKKMDKGRERRRKREMGMAGFLGQTEHRRSKTARAPGGGEPCRCDPGYWEHLAAAGDTVMQ